MNTYSACDPDNGRRSGKSRKRSRTVAWAKCTVFLSVYWAQCHSATIHYFHSIYPQMFHHSGKTKNGDYYTLRDWGPHCGQNVLSISMVWPYYELCIQNAVIWVECSARTLHNLHITSIRRNFLILFTKWISYQHSLSYKREYKCHLITILRYLQKFTS